MSEYDDSTSEPDEESLNLRIEETATEVSGMETGPSQSPVRNSRPKKKKRIIRPMSPDSEAESESILTEVHFKDPFYFNMKLLYVTPGVSFVKFRLSNTFFYIKGASGQVVIHLKFSEIH